ncbi:hypothetical protein M3Y98_00036000 [Aphelenchoides besseyi]|nr:hypothetical protein M3Y98_00036000 [Aphelenchoides besseyi]KAI6199085.1 hypothetical protein M3Y96_00589100 [Aphelenchoides besseyi]
MASRLMRSNLIVLLAFTLFLTTVNASYKFRETDECKVSLVKCIRLIGHTRGSVLNMWDECQRLIDAELRSSKCRDKEKTPSDF